METTIKRIAGQAAFMLMVTQVSQAGGFSLYTEASPAAIGNFAAGIAAEGADASIGWYNPAGLVLLEKQELLIGGVGVFPSQSLNGTSTFSTPPLPPYVQTINGLQGKKDAVVPSIHYAYPIGPNAVLGLSIVSPFGLATNWGTTSPVRYASTYNELHTVDVSPEIGGKFSENFSFGLGIDMQWAKVKINRVLGSPAVLQFLNSFNPAITATTFDSVSANQGDSYGVGYHLGALGMSKDKHTRIGLNYQSSITHRFMGDSNLKGRLADPLVDSADAVFWNNGLTSNDITFPYITTLSMYQDVNERLALLGSVVYSGWSSFKTIQLNGVAAYSVELDQQVLLNSSSPENYHDAWRFALGGNYRLTDQWLFRVGGGYDQTPTNNIDRNVRLPDSNRWALSLGAHYQPWTSVGVDVGYTYLFGGTSYINNTIPIGASSSYLVDVSGDVHAQLFGLQAVWTIS